MGALIVKSALRAGAPPGSLEAETGFDPHLGSDPDARISLGLESALWDSAARLSEDSAFGLHAAEWLEPGAVDVLDYVVRAAPTLLASLERLARYNALVHDAAIFRLQQAEGSLRIEHSLGAATQSRHAAEFTLASIVVVGSQLVGKPLRALSLEFRHPLSDSAEPREYERVFGVTPRFGASLNALTLPLADVERPNRSADPRLLRMIECHAQALLAQRPAPLASTTDHVRTLLATTLANVDADAALPQIANKLHMSERSLQRRLAAEGTSFDSLLDELRRELSLRYLSDQRISIAEIAYLLGYSEPSAFHRAFKRWTGATPRQLRSAAAVP